MTFLIVLEVFALNAAAFALGFILGRGKDPLQPFQEALEARRGKVLFPKGHAPIAGLPEAKDETPDL